MPTMNDAAGASPAMAQWFAIKARHEDALLFFRMGDFYELFFADAQAASAALDIALTARGSHQGQPVSMCGVPVSQAEEIVFKVRSHGGEVWYLEAADEGHGFRKQASRGAYYLAVAQFLKSLP